jgi:hypothetical protein
LLDGHWKSSERTSLGLLLGVARMAPPPPAETNLKINVGNSENFAGTPRW